jgi:predicted O-methyltransferase YrrM
MADDELAALRAVLDGHRRRGYLGTVSTEAALEHSQLVADVFPTGARVLDLGSGGGLPGLVLAVARPDLHVELLDLRERRTDALRQAVGRLQLQDRVTVRTGDISRLASTTYADAFDGMTARAFGPLPQVLRWGRLVVRVGGLVAVSCPPELDVANVEVPDGLVWLRTIGPWSIWCRATPHWMMFHVKPRPEGRVTPREER